MTVVEFEAKKAELINYISDNVNTEDVLSKLSALVNDLIVKYPCCYSSEEIQASADRAIEAFKRGETNRFISHDEMRKKHLL